jgi:hypothetical protein
MEFCILDAYQKRLHMKRSNLLVLGLCFLAACNNPSSEKKEDKKDSATANKEEKFVPVDSATAMKNWQAYATPSDMHKMIAKWDGTWNMEMSSWMSPDAPPVKSTGKSVNKMVLNGLYQESIYTGTMMGMPFEGHGTLGYDNAKKMFISTWVDNMGSGIMKMEGAWDEATKSMTLKGVGIDPSSGKECNMREVFKLVDDNTQTMEMYGPSPKDGKESKMMEVKFTRTK